MAEPVDPDLAGVLAEALSEGLRAHAVAHGLPPLVWRVDRGTVTGQAGADYPDSDVPAVLHAWAAHLGLTARPAPMAGTAAYAGSAHGLALEVWGVTDDDAVDRS